MQKKEFIKHEYSSLLFAQKASYDKWRSAYTMRVIEENAVDMNLRQVINAISEDPDFPAEYYLCPAQDSDTAAYRIETFRKLSADMQLLSDFKRAEELIFSLKSAASRCHAAKETLQRSYFFIILAASFCETAEALQSLFERYTFKSVTNLKSFLLSICSSEKFYELKQRAAELIGELKECAPQYAEFNFEAKIVSPFFNLPGSDTASRLGSVMKSLFGIVPKMTFTPFHSQAITPFEQKLIEKIGEHNDGLFKRMAEFLSDFDDFDVFILTDIRKELLFYTKYIDFIRRLSRNGLCFCFPRYISYSLTLNGYYDLSLAVSESHRGKSDDSIVKNDMNFERARIAIITGPNQGGKTTCLRAILIIAHLAKNGCPVPAQSADLPWFSNIFTHFYRQESQESRGRLREEISRFKHILALSDKATLVVSNESFSSTRRQESVYLSKKVLSELIAKNSYVLYVTHCYEISNDYIASREKTVKSFTAEVDNEDTGERSYRIVPAPPSGFAHAATIAKECGITCAAMTSVLRSTAVEIPNNIAVASDTRGDL